MFSKKATKVEKIFILDLTLCSKCQIDGEDFVNFCGLLRKLKKMPCAWFFLKSFLSLSFFSTYVKGFLKKYPSLFKISCLLSVYNRGSFVKFFVSRLILFGPVRLFWSRQYGSFWYKELSKTFLGNEVLSQSQTDPTGCTKSL